MPARTPALLTALLIAGAALATGYLSASNEGDGAGGGAKPAVPSQPQPQSARVVRVIDGDTIQVRVGGRDERVRLLGIDTPERTTLRTGRTECGGDAARSAAQALAEQSTAVTLQTDPSQDAYDRYGRLLAYVTPAAGGRTWQETLLAQGWAKVYVLERRPIARLSAFRSAAAAARRNRAGVWSQCGGDFRRPIDP